MPNQKPFTCIEVRQEYNGQKDKQWSTKHYKHYTENQRLSNTNTTKNRCKLICLGRASSSCSTSGTRCINVKRHEHHMTWKSCWTPVCVKIKLILSVLTCIIFIHIDNTCILDFYDWLTIISPVVFSYMFTEYQIKTNHNLMAAIHMG